MSKQATNTLQVEILNLHRARALGKLGRSEEAKILLDKIFNQALQNSKRQVLDEIAVHWPKKQKPKMNLQTMLICKMQGG